MRHEYKDMSQGINPEPSAEVRKGGKKKEKRKKRQWLTFLQTNAAQLRQRWHKNRFAYRELSGKSKSSVGFI